MYGVSTYALHSLPLPAALDQIAELTDCVEVMDDGCHYIENAEPLLSYDLKYSIHAPSRSVNIASTLEPIREASVRVIEDCFSIAAEVDADVVVHPGYFAWLADREKAHRQFIRSLGDLSAAAEDRSIRYAVENMAWEFFFLQTPDELPLPDGAGFALDVGHANIVGCLPAFLQTPINHIHLHDNDGTQDSHSAIGSGTIDFAAVMRAVGQNGLVPVIEVDGIDAVKTSISAIRSYL